MKSLTTILFTIFCTFCFAQEPATKTPVNTNCDTLILREICDYCAGEASYYYPHKFGNTTVCLCYTDIDTGVEVINQFIKNNQNGITCIRIENPSNIITRLDFSPLQQIKTLEIFGNDYNCDAISKFPAELLEKPTFTTIKFDGVRFPSEEMKKMKKKYKHIKIHGDPSEYEEGWDGSVHKY